MRLPLLAALLLVAAPAKGEGEPVRRHVIAIMGGVRPRLDTTDIVHAVLEMPLNHLGLVVHRHYVAEGPPPEAWLDEACAVVTYFTSIADPADWLWPWLEREVPKRKLRVVHFGNFGPLGADPERLARWLRAFGLAHDERAVEGAARVEAKVPPEAALEADPRTRAVHRGPRNDSPANRVWVETRDRLAPEDVRAPVVTGSWGGLALDPWTLTEGSDNEERRWHLDPFLFLAEALGVRGVPAPHPSVLNGRRMWFLQVDGDGFESLSSVKPNALSAQVMLDEVFRKHALPFTVSVIVRGLTDDYAIAEPNAKMLLAREILNLPNVEPASHGVLHTLKWEEEAGPGEIKSGVGGMMWYPSLANYTYGRVNEVRESIRFINERLLVPPRRCALMLWTGNTLPPEEAILVAGEMGSRNLNGGVFRWDPWYDSVGFVSPWSRRVGKALQVYAGAANENDFEGFFDTMPGAFGHVAETIARAGAPRVLKPADIYVHFYSAENPVRLAALQKLIRRFAFEEESAPVFASAYVEAVEAAVERARVRRAPDGWVFRDFGACRTARIDGEPRDVDFARSRGLLGARRVGDSLYLHLAGSDAQVVLASGPQAHPHVEQANCVLENARLAPAGVTAVAKGHCARLVVLAGFPPNAPLLVTIGSDTTERRSDAAGRIELRIDTPGETRYSVQRVADASR
ncbi:MAG: hypothetical protein L6Q95_06715 [Planctomycetes bacterium]|nr:hypothetical protein [Planctomycetota bacterium]